jgi:hypothetical protein
MKKLFLPLILLFVFSFFVKKSMCQAAPPQAMSYSAIAKGSNGQMLANKIISLRFTIMTGSVTGTVVYQETQTDTTDQHGLFATAIGFGTPLQGTFAAINWGSDNHYLKVELDENGGVNYFYVGTTQLLSVPYALYAKNAGNVINNTASDDLLFPDGINGQPVIIFPDSSYTVPSGKTLYITWGTTGSNEFLISGTDTFWIPSRGIIKENLTLTAKGNLFMGLVVDKNIEIVNWNTSSPYTVPAGKSFYLISGTFGNVNFLINGVGYNSSVVGGETNIPIFPGNTVLSIIPSTYSYNRVFTGYLK